MLGCYRCGLPDGSPERLCDTCFLHRFRCDSFRTSDQANSEPQGIELSPKFQRWLLSGGAMLYLGVVSLGIVVQEDRAAARNTSASSSILRVGGNSYPVSHSREFGYLAGPTGDQLE